MTPEGTVGPVERKLAELGEVQGVVSGNFGEVSEATHALVAALATCRVRVAGVTRGRRGHMRSEEGERSLAIAGLRRRLGVLTVSAKQCLCWAGWRFLGREQVRQQGGGGRQQSWRAAGGGRSGRILWPVPRAGVPIGLALAS